MIHITAMCSTKSVLRETSYLDATMMKYSTIRGCPNTYTCIHLLGFDFRARPFDRDTPQANSVRSRGQRMDRMANQRIIAVALAEALVDYRQDLIHALGV